MHTIGNIPCNAFGRSGLCSLLIALFLCNAPQLNATVVTFDWPSSPGWTAGVPTPGQTKTQSFTSVDPDDITVSINNSGASSQGMDWQSGYPQISTSPITGGFSGVNGLELSVTSSQVVGSYIEVTVTFATPVINLSFQIWDVDHRSNQYSDQISSIQALAYGGGIVGATSVTSAVPGYNTITGTGLGTVVTGIATADNSTNEGTIDIIFSGPITQFSFRWSNSDPALEGHGIALGPLNYTPVPEIDPACVVSIICALGIAFEISRRRRKLLSQ